MGYTGIIQFRRNSLRPDHICHLGHGRLTAVNAAPPVHQLPAYKCQYCQNQNDGNDVNDVKLSDAFCFLLHGFLRKRRIALIFSFCGQCTEGIV